MWDTASGSWSSSLEASPFHGRIGNVENIIVIAEITQVEIVSAAFRRHREGSISLQTANAIRQLLDRHVATDYKIVGLSALLVHRAEDLLGNHTLRASDAIQLASAIEANEQLLREQIALLTFVSADKRLLTAASAEGLAIDDPNTHP